MCPTTRPNPAETALTYLGRGWVPIPLLIASKGKLPKDWNKLRISAEDVGEHFTHAHNVGVLLGSASRWLVDVDIDNPFARRVAETMLPATNSVYGRPGKPNSHRLYYAKGALTKQYSDRTTGAMLIELRGEGKQGPGAQSVFPGSVHPSGELIEWVTDLEPATVPADALQAAVGQVAAVALLASHWPAPGTRHYAILALAGGLQRAGFSADEAIAFQRHVYDALGEGGDSQIENIRNVVVSTYTSTAKEKSGWKTLGDYLQGDGAKAIRLFCQWMGFDTAETGADGRRLIILRDDYQRTIDEVEPFVSRYPALYVSAGQLHEHFSDPETGRQYLSAISVPRLRTIVSSQVALAKLVDEGVKKIVPPEPFLTSYLAGPYWPSARLVEQIVEWPFVGPDDELVVTNGYHPRSRRILATQVVLDPGLPLTEYTIDDARAALQLLREPFSEYPFEVGAGADAAIAYILTVLARPRIDGPVPALIVDANSKGAGKTLISDVCSHVISGQKLARDSLSFREEEIQKVLLSMAVDRRPMILFDNLDVPFGGPSLDGVITAGKYVSGRVLGASKMATLPWVSCLITTGNNVSVKGDTQRRIIACRILAPENPEAREFRRTDLLGWVARNRSDLLRAALVLLRAYALAGRPLGSRERPTFGSFEAWQEVVADAILWAGGDNVAETRRIFEDDDTQTEEIDRLHSSWLAAYGSRLIDTRELTELGSTRMMGPEESKFELWQVLKDCAADTRVGHPTARSIGYFLRRYKAKVRNGQALRRFRQHGKIAYAMTGNLPVASEALADQTDLEC